MNLSVLNANYIDLLILLVFAFFISEAFHHGFWVILADFFAFFGSLVFGLRFYPFLAEILRVNFSLVRSLSSALGFLITAVLVESVLGFLLGHLISKIHEKHHKKLWLKSLGVIPALGEALVLIAFVLTLVLSFPIRPQIKADVTSSVLGGKIVEKTQGLEARVNEIFGGVIEQSITYLTIKPGSKERVALESQPVKLKIDEQAETEMYELINKERAKLGTKELLWAPELVPVARAHAEDMWQKSYFGHFSPEGEDAGDRLGEAKINYFVVGENLALAPTVSIAHTGLMNSEGHRTNILDPEFEKVGIGVIDNGVYGKMFVQIFIR